MAELEIADLHKSYGRKAALRGIDLSVADGEFFVILGPSGAGKTTTLKSVAGLQDIDRGSVRIGGVDMEGVEPYRRNVAMAFESYALYPQDTVFDNLASPLRSGRLGSYPADDLRRRIEMVTATLGIDTLLERYPRELSNGQRQRVALGRVLVRPAGVYLLDEPLSHLDAKLRAAMRAELKSLGAMSSTTSLYVTHDYQEALALGDRIAVLREGEVAQVGTPYELWHHPSDTFVAQALGQPEMNLLPGRVDAGDLVVAGGAIRIPVRGDLDLAAGDEIVVGVRPRDVGLVSGPAPRGGGEGVTADGQVHLVEVLGRLVELSVGVGDTEIIVVVGSAEAPREGDRIQLRIPLETAVVFGPVEPDRDGRAVPLSGSVRARQTVRVED